MKPFQGTTRIVLWGFYVSHIVATILIDGQVFVPQLYPQALQDVLQWYIQQTGDPLMSQPHPQWFIGAVIYEWRLQLPYCCCAAYFFSPSQPTNQMYPDWFRTYSIIYGTNTCTTMMLILHHLYMDEQTLLLPLYMPYLLAPLYILYYSSASAASACTTNNKSNNKTKAT